MLSSFVKSLVSVILFRSLLPLRILSLADYGSLILWFVIDFVDFDMCGYGTPYKKPTRVMSNIPGIQRLARKCCHRSHESPLVSRKCMAAGEYPKGLCRLMSSVLKSCLSNEAFSSSSDLLDNMVSELCDVYASRSIWRRGESKKSAHEFSEAEARGRHAIRRFNVRFPREQ